MQRDVTVQHRQIALHDAAQVDRTAEHGDIADDRAAVREAGATAETDRGRAVVEFDELLRDLRRELSSAGQLASHPDRHRILCQQRC